jgi:hypothetical protein
MFKRTASKDKKARKLADKYTKDNPCWKGYKAVGMKKKNGKMVPNCVPIDD